MRMKLLNAKDSINTDNTHQFRILKEERLRQMHKRHSFCINEKDRNNSKHSQVIFFDDSAFSKTDIPEGTSNPVLLKIEAFTEKRANKAGKKASFLNMPHLWESATGRERLSNVVNGNRPSAPTTN